MGGRRGLSVPLLSEGNALARQRREKQDFPPGGSSQPFCAPHLRQKCGGDTGNLFPGSEKPGKSEPVAAVDGRQKSRRDDLCRVCVPVSGIYHPAAVWQSGRPASEKHLFSEKGRNDPVVRGSAVSAGRGELAYGTARAGTAECN